MDRKKKLLAILLTVWGILIVYRLSTQEEPKRVPLKYVKGQTVSKREWIAREGSPLLVRLDLLKERAAISLRHNKNIFAPVRVYLPPPPPSPLPPPPPELPPPPPSPEELAIEQARRDLSQFRYLGYLNKGPGNEQAFLARQQELFIVGKGQPVSGTIVLKELTSSYVILQESNTRVEVTLTISGG